MSLCYLPTAEKLSIAILECKELRTKDVDEKYTGTLQYTILLSFFKGFVLPKYISDP